IVYQTRWRPIRVGWCVSKGKMDVLVKAFRLSHCLWGGRFNPIIAIDDDPKSRLLVDVFRVDVLWAVERDERSTAFVKSVSHLPSPFLYDELFRDRAKSKECILLDVTHPIRLFYESYVKDKVTPTRTTLYDWLPDDPLASVFEATFGRYPDVSESGVD